MDKYREISKNGRFAIQDEHITVSSMGDHPEPVFDLGSLSREELIHYASVGLRLSAGAEIRRSEVNTHEEFVEEYRRALDLTIKCHRTYKARKAKAESN